MNLNLIFSNINIIILIIWIVFLAIVALRFFNPIWLKSNNSFLQKIITSIKNVSFFRLVLIAFLINVLYGLFISWGQYYVWSTASDFTKSLVSLPLPKEAPMPSLLEWMRPFFENNFGYFLYYILGRFWLNIFISFFISTILYFVFRTWKSFHGNFSPNGPELFFILMLAVGWPGVLVLIPLGFVLSVLVSIFFNFKGKTITAIEPTFILTSIIVLIFGNIILSFF